MNDDGANGYEVHAAAFMRRRNAAIGSAAVRSWAANFDPGAPVLELGCGHGTVSEVLVEAYLHLRVVDSSPTLLGAFRQRFPDIPAELARAETCDALNRQYMGIVAWGLIFLMGEADQHTVLRRSAQALTPGGRLLFTAPEQPVSWTDSVTELPSRSLGAAGYRTLLEGFGLELLPGYTDQGENFHYSCIKPVG